MLNKKPIIVQQATDLSAIGGTTSEFKALSKSKLSSKYNIIPMVLPKVHKKVNLQDIIFYYKFLKKAHPDIVQIRGAAIDGLNAQIAARMIPGVKILLCVHGMFSELVYLSPAKRVLHKYIIEPIIFHMCDGISCVYKKGNDRPQLKKYKEKLLPVVYNRLPSIGKISKNDFEHKRLELGLPVNAVVGVYCGRFNREKGLNYLLEALQNIKKIEWPENFYILMIGDGDYLCEFKNECKKDGLNEYVRCVGKMKNVYPLLQISDFFIMPSLHENHSIALLEAVAAELPIIATDVGGNGEIVRDGIEGVLIPPADSEALAKAILMLSKDHSKREELKSNIIENHYQQFSDECVDEQLDLVYQLMLSK